MPLARNTFLRTIAEFAEGLGVPRNELLEEIDLEPAVMDEPGAFIDSSKLIDAVAYGALASGRRDFGLVLGAQNDHRVMGPVGLLIEHCRTIADAVGEGSRYLHLHNAALHYTLAAGGGAYTFRVQLGTRGRYPSHQYVETLLAMTVGFCRVMLGDRWAPLGITFEHERQADRAAYRRVFGADVKFGQPLNAIVAKKHDFDRRLSGEDARIRRMIQRLLDDIDREHSENIVARVSLVLRPLLSTGNARAAHVAKLLSLSPRTLQRRLAEHRTTFQDVLHDVRLQLAREHLPRPGMTLAQLAPILGFSEASAACRFLRHNGGLKRYKRKASEKVRRAPPKLSASALAVAK